MSNFLIISENKSVWYKNGTHQSETVAKTVKKAKTRSAAKNVVKIVYPIFEKMAELDDDLLWKEIFTNFSHGVCKRGFSFTLIKDDLNVGVLTYKIKTKEYQCYVKSDPALAFVEVKHFMNEYGGVLSETDKINKTTEMQNHLCSKSENAADNWSKVRNNVAKRVLTGRFAKNYCIQNNISLDRVVELKQMIDFYLIFKIEVKMRDGIIIEIPALSYVNGVFSIEMPINKTRTKCVDNDDDDDDDDLYNQNDNYNKCYKNYNKFLEDLDKRIGKRFNN